MHTATHTQPILTSLIYLAEVVQHRVQSHFKQDPVEPILASIPQPQFNGVRSAFLDFVRQHDLNNEEFLLLLIALAPHIQSDFFEEIIQGQIPDKGNFPQFGGVRGKEFRGMLPTGETALFILAGNDFQKRFQIQELFSEDHFFAKNRILWLSESPEGEPIMSGKIVLSQEYIDLFCFGKITRPRFSLKFPAQLVETNLEWSDLVLEKNTIQQIRELETWVKHGDTLLYDWKMLGKIKSGYRVLFYGPPGTGKTLTASLLGKYTGKDVYKIDLSMMVSKFIGETEKNLANLFTKAENKNWILFFDEADALFGKRTNVKDAHDKYANQEVSYLLQRVESYNGLVILATNFKNNIDDAFVRRFQSIIHFPLPKTPERLRLWEHAFPKQVSFAPDVQFSNIAHKYELSGGEIINVVQSACLAVLEKGGHVITDKLIVEAIRKEYKKEERMMR